MSKMVKLPLRQRKFLKYYLASGNAAQSIEKAGFKDYSYGYDVLKSPNFQNAFQIYLEKSGIDDNRIQSKLNELLDCKKLHSCDLLVKNKNGKLVVNENSNDFIEVPDNQSQVKALELAVKLKGHLQPADTKINIDTGDKTIVFVRPGGNSKSPVEPQSLHVGNPGEDFMERR